MQKFLGKPSTRPLTFVLAAFALLATLLATSQAFAISNLSTTLSTSSVTAGSKVDLTTQIPAVNATDLSTQEIVQSIDPSKVKLTGLTDIVAPDGWTVTVSTDGVNFVAPSTLTTAAQWATVSKVKASGKVNSLGAGANGKQIYSTTVTAAGSIATSNGTNRANGDGFDVEFDSRGYVFNAYHHNQLNSGVDCRNISDGTLCSGSWPFPLSSYGFYSNFSSTSFFDEVNRHLWLPVSDRSTGTGFVCLDVSTISTPNFCGGSKATGWHMVNARSGAMETGVYQIIGSAGKVYSWDILAPKVLCYDYLANNGLGADCAALPTFPHLVAGSANPDTTHIPTTMAFFQRAFGNLYGELNGVAICFNETTMAKCAGWAEFDYVLGTTTTYHAMYLQPNADGSIKGVCFETDAQCFAANGTRFATNATIQAALNRWNISRWQNSIITSGSKLLFNGIWDQPSYVYCYDYATSAACSNWTASSALGVSGVGQKDTAGWRVYTLANDPRNSDCIWTNGDSGGSVQIGQFTASTAATGCSLTVNKPVYAQRLLQPRMTCLVGNDVVYHRFEIGGMTAGVDYSSATLTVLKASGEPVVSGGKTWSQVAFNSSGVVDLSTLAYADLGTGASFQVAYAGRTSTAASSGTLVMESESAQLCVSVTANVACPTSTLITNLPTQTTSFSATAATIPSTGGRIDYTTTSSDLSIAPPANASACGFVLSAVVGRGYASQAYPANAAPVAGAVATLADTSGNVLKDELGNPITATSDANGNLSFGVVKAGSYTVKFADFPIVNGFGAGDVASTYISPFGFFSGQINRTPQNPDANFLTIQAPLATPAFTGVTGTPTTVKALYVMRASAKADAPAIKANAATTIDVLANDSPTTTASWTTTQLFLCAAGTTSNCALTSLAVANQGTYSVSSGKIIFTPLSGFTGAVTPATYQIKDNYATNSGQIVTALLSPTVAPAPVASADTLTGNLLAPITVDVTTNDTAASATSIDKASVKLCAAGTITGCALTSVAITGKGTYSVNASGVVTFAPEATYVGAVPAITYSVNDVAGNTSTATVTATVTATPPVITTPAFPAAAHGIAMATDNQTVTAGSATIPATGAWQIVSGALPDGLVLDANTGAITGTPTAIGTFNFTVQVTDGGGLSATKAESITVYYGPTVTTEVKTYKVYTGAASTVPNTATAGSGALRTTGAWSATGLPAGLTIDGTSGVISGTPTTAGSSTVVVRVTDINGLFDEETITIQAVTKPVITTATPLTPAVANTAITAISQSKTAGSAPIAATGAWSISAGALPTGLTFNNDTGEITGTPTVTGNFTFTVKLTDTNGEVATKEETIAVNSGPTITTTPLSYKLYQNIAGSVPMTVTIGTGAIRTSTGWSATGLPAGLTINGTTGVISGTPTAVGSSTVTVRATDVNGLFDEEIITITVASKPNITTATPLTSAVMGTAITAIPQTVTPGAASIPATGAWSIVSGALPAGLAFNANTGEITGTPTVSGNFTFTVQVTDSAGEVSTKVESLAVNTPPTVTTTPTTFNLPINTSVSIANTATPGTGALRTTGAWSATGLPAGLVIDGTTGIISGVPNTLGTTAVTVRVTDVNGLFDEETLNLTVFFGPTVTTAPSYKFGVNNDIDLALDDFFAQSFSLGKSRAIINTATKGSAEIPAKGAWSATNLPEGLVLNPDTGKITGAATKVGIYKTVVKVTDAAGMSGTKELTIDIVQGPKNTTPRVYNYQVDIGKRIGLGPESITQTYTLGSAPLNPGRPVPFLVQGGKPAVVTSVSITTGEIQLLPSLAFPLGKGYGSYTLKTVIVDNNNAYDIATFTINVVNPAGNLTTLTLPTAIAGGTPINTTLYPLSGSSSKKLAVSYSVSTPKVCAIDSASKKLKLLNEGTCTVTAQSGTGKLLSKDTKSFVITKTPQEITALQPGADIPGTSNKAPLATDDPNGFQLIASVDSGLLPVYTSLDPTVCSVDAGGVVTWDADLTVLPKVETDFHCRVRVTQPGDFTRSAAAPKVLTLDATHVEPPAPEGGIAKEAAQVAALPATGGTTPMKGGNSFKVIVDKTKKTVTVQPISKGRWIGPIYADISISYTPKGSTTEQTQICKRNYFGISVTDPKTKQIMTPALGGDPLVIPEMSTNSKGVAAMIAIYRAMKGKFSTTATVKGKKVVYPGYLDYKYFNGQASCVLDTKAYAAWKSGVQIKATALVTRDRRWPTTYTRYKSYDWKNKSNDGIIYPTLVQWIITVG